MPTKHSIHNRGLDRQLRDWIVANVPHGDIVDIEAAATALGTSATSSQDRTGPIRQTIAAIHREDPAFGLKRVNEAGDTHWPDGTPVKRGNYVYEPTTVAPAVVEPEPEPEPEPEVKASDGTGPLDVEPGEPFILVLKYFDADEDGGVIAADEDGRGYKVTPW